MTALGWTLSVVIGLTVVSIAIYLAEKSRRRATYDHETSEFWRDM
ncbi:hypothetical protein [Rhizobium sp. ARZ01]|nr:hypothetical protein [Rhizobium sp. ARZ01]